MTRLKFKDYQGSVTFVDGTLLVQILHIDDYVTTECSDAAKVQQAFEELVDDYLATCLELQKSPSKPFKGSFNVRVSPELHRAVAMTASDAGQSLNAWVEVALRQKVERQNSVRRLASLVHVLDTDALNTRWKMSSREFEITTNPVVSTRSSYYN